MSARLLFRDSAGRDGQVALSPSTPCYVGRALDCAIRTDDPMVSRKHSMIRMERDGYYVEDLGSSNGTLVNNHRVSKHRLSHNDLLQCGSLFVRYVEDGPIAVPGQGQPAPGRHGSPAGGGAPAGGPAGGASQPWMGGQPGTNPHGGAPAPNAPGTGKRGTQRLEATPGEVGGQPVQPGHHSPPAGPASHPGQAGVFGGAAAQAGASGIGQPQQYGGPPAMPDGAAGGFGPPSMPGDTPADGNPFGPPTMPPADSGDDGTSPGGYNPFARPAGEREGTDDDDRRVAGELEAARKRLDELQSNYDREVADGKRLRAETATLRENIEKLEGTVEDRDDQIRSHQGVAEDLRRELEDSRDQLSQIRNQLAEQSEDMLAKERQVGRIQDDIAKLKEDREDLARQLTEVSKTKDEGWKKLNDQLGEIEHLREVINEQERMLEERKVGLISQEEAIKELRADKEKQIKVFAQVKAERDGVVADMRRGAAQLQAVEEENKRLSRMLAESQSGGIGDGQAAVKLTNELREVRIEHKKLEADRDRYQEMYERADAEVKRLESRVAQLEVELRESNERKTAVASTQSVIEDSLAKAEIARHKAAEEALAASKERDEAVAKAEKVQRESDRLRQRLEALEDSAREGREDTELVAENEALKRKLEAATGQLGDLDRVAKGLRDELEAAKAAVVAAEQRAKEADAAASVAASAVANAAASAAGDSGAGAGADADAAAAAALADTLRQKALEVYQNVNDVLSEIRNNLRLVQRDVDGLSAKLAGGGDPAGDTDQGPAAGEEQSADELRIMKETLQTLVDNAEDAKGVVRGLRELAEFA